MTIAAATLEADSVVVRVEGASRGTRVSLLGGRYLHSWDAGEALQPLAPPQPDLLEPGFTGNGYLEDRRPNSQGDPYKIASRILQTIATVPLPTKKGKK